jgi:hypothetical protein
MAKKEKSFYQRLTRLFRSGPAIRRKIRGQDYKNFYDNQVVQNNLGYYGAAGFKREASPFSVMGAYGILDRMSRYAEFAEMEGTADIATALNVYADESCASDENGKTFHIYSEVPQVQRALEELFYDVMNIEFNARRMIRNLVKNGDYFMYVEVIPEYGVINVEPLPVNEVEREEGFDKHDPYAVRFRLITRGGKYLENWQMLHFRILGNDLFIPYGTSFLESARRPWRQLCHLSGTRVLTSTGYKNIEDIIAGETVYTHVPESKQTVKAKVKHVLDMGKQPIVSVETSHRTIKVTPNHGLLTLDKNGTFLYKKASELVQSCGQEGSVSRQADKLVLPAVMSGNPSLQINFEDFATNYSVKLTKKASEVERKGIMRRLKQLGTTTGYKNVHLFLNGSKKLSWSDYQLVQKEFALTTPVEYYYSHSKKKSVFFGANNHSFTLDKDFMKFFGFMLGDGWTKDNGFGFGLGVYEQQNDEYIGYTSKLFGNDYFISKRKGTQSAQVNWATTEVADVLRHLGFKTGFANKHIPDWVYGLDLSARRALVQGMFDADGCDNTKTICFANKKLIEQTQELCWTIGIPTGKTISVRPEREGHKESYKLWLDLTKPSEEVVYENVVRVVQEEQGQTWDLEVDHEEHNFLANGVVTHNTMMEDSMLVYRLVRSPERRVFYIDVSAVHPNDIPSYMEAVKEGMRGASVIEQQTGRQDFRYNPLAIDEDYFLPTRPNNQTKIESLAGGQNATAIEDVEYIHRKLIAALMVPKAYLTYDEAISSKATLAQEDIRFSRTVGQLQKILVAELNKLAMIHLYALGFSGDDLLSFEINFSNPSTVAVQQKLALISSKLEIAGKALELSKDTGLLSFNYIQREILSLRPEQINVIKQEARQDQVTMAELKKIAENPPFDKSIDSNIDIFDQSNYEVPKSPFAPDQKEVRKIEQQNHEQELELQTKRNKEREEKSGNNGAPIRFSPTPNLDKSFRKSRRSKAFTGDRALVMPDFKKMLDITNNRYAKDPYDMESMRKFVLEEANIKNSLFGSVSKLPFGVTKEMQTTLHKLSEALGVKPQPASTSTELFTESAENEEESLVDDIDDELFLIEKDLKSE